MPGELITADGQLQFRDYLLGDDETTFLVTLNGWEEIPGVDSGNVSRPASHGSWAGNKLSGQRIITWEGRFATSPAAWATRLKTLREAFSLPLGTEEEEIVIRLHDEMLLSYGAVRARSLPADKRFAAYGANLVIQFECSDPRRYSVTENSLILAFPTETESGLEYPISYDLYYGESPSTSGDFENDGNVFTPVVIEISGPVTGPEVKNLTLDRILKFDITLAESETLVIDTRSGTVLLNNLADRLYTRSLSSVPLQSFGLTPGINSLNISADSWSAPAEIEIKWRDATL